MYASSSPRAISSHGRSQRTPRSWRSASRPGRADRRHARAAAARSRSGRPRGGRGARRRSHVRAQPRRVQRSAPAALLLPRSVAAPAEPRHASRHTRRFAPRKHERKTRPRHPPSARVHDGRAARRGRFHARARTHRLHQGAQSNRGPRTGRPRSVVLLAHVRAAQPIPPRGRVRCRRRGRRQPVVISLNLPYARTLSSRASSS